MGKINFVEKAKNIWLYLIECSNNKQLYSYKDIGNRVELHWRMVGRALEPIQKYCLDNNLPPLTILVVNSSKKPGVGFIAAKSDEIDQKTKEVYNFDWSKIDNPFDIGLSEEDIVRNIINKNFTQKEVIRKIIDRGLGQTYFREAILKIYFHQCCICSIAIPELLQAAHIKPYKQSNDEEKFNINNGILLCANHHQLFDKQILTITENYKIKIVNVDNNIQANREFVSIYDGRTINLPKNVSEYPNKKLLNERNLE
ncbi:hypothetical protein FACS1894130_10820 [Spirochaetia bacterium]|nr:hypothetical protein FACS1894130_10820 [Spirochaetia bacterium]